MTDKHATSQNSSITAGVVVHDTPANTLKQTLTSLRASTVPLEVVLLCNSKNPQIQQSCLNLALQHNCTFRGERPNRGFGAAHNEIITTCNTPWYLCCNPDIVVTPSAIERLISFGETHTSVGLLQPKVVGPDGVVQPLARKHLTLWRWVRRQIWRLVKVGTPPDAFMFDYNQTQPTEYVTGCFFLARTEQLKKLGGFDERFFIYAEEADLSKRVSETATNYYIAEACVTHEWGQAWRHSPFALFHEFRSLWIYFRKHGFL